METLICSKCNEIFICNSQKVPRAKKKPICKDCIEIINAARREVGMEEIYVDGAYPK